MMKRILVLVALMLMLVACGPKQAPDYELSDIDKEVQDEAPLADDIVTEEEPEPKEAEKEVGRQPPAYTPPSQKAQTPPQETETAEAQETETPDVDPALRDLLKRADEKVTSYSYLYRGPETGDIAKDTYYVKGDMIKVKYYEEDYYVRENETTHAYLDTDAKTAYGCCEVPSRCFTPEQDYRNTKFMLEYADVYGELPKTPYQWVQEISDAEIVGTETFNARSVTVIKYERPDGSTVHMKIDDTYGLPHQVVITKGEEELAKHQFNDLNVNSYKDEDFVPPCSE